MRVAQEQEYVEYVTARMPALSRLAYALCGDGHRADDIVQQAITRLYAHWARASAADNLDAYVRTIVVRAYLDEKRLAWATRVRLSTSPPERAAPDGPDLDDRAVLQRALARVPRRQRAVLVLRFVYDLPVEEVASVLGCSPGTVKSQTSHGLAALRRLLGAQSLAALRNGS
jgi:RNA polymerase sigma-70 factor (sigma-E family)